MFLLYIGYVFIDPHMPSVDGIYNNPVKNILVVKWGLEGNEI